MTVIIIFWMSCTFPGSVARALQAADWSPRSGSGSADDAETGVCDFLQIIVKSASLEETGGFEKTIPGLGQA